jgi:hypothetical protein
VTQHYNRREPRLREAPKKERSDLQKQQDLEKHRLTVVNKKKVEILKNKHKREKESKDKERKSAMKITSLKTQTIKKGKE